ncbi:MAG TPA: TlpA disulfide reductase family protein [Jiangellaceae bacterium]|nr:TlpA disulfide reductase family protein [Jiangellaceae bacterium]
MRIRYVVVTLAAAVMVVGGCSDGQVGRTDGGQTRYVQGSGAVTLVPADTRDPAPDFGGPLLGGGDFDLAAARGDVVVLNVWGSWCPPCREEAPDLQAVNESFDGQGVQFVGVNVRDNDVDAQAFEREFGLTYPSVIDENGSRLLAFRDTLPPTSIPSTLVVDRQGRMAASVLGQITEASLRDLVSSIAAEQASADGGGTAGDG